MSHAPHSIYPVAPPAINLVLIDKHRVCQKRGDRNSKLYADIGEGLCTKPVKIGARGSRWPEHEIDAVLHARMAGASDDEIRALVSRLHDLRQQQFATVMAQVAA